MKMLRGQWLSMLACLIWGGFMFFFPIMPIMEDEFVLWDISWLKGAYLTGAAVLYVLVEACIATLKAMPDKKRALLALGVTMVMLTGRDDMNISGDMPGLIEIAYAAAGSSAGMGLLLLGRSYAQDWG